jgi:hypothetical protein
MATLDNSNIINGNTVETADILQLYTALGTGNPGDITGLVITGSFQGDVSGTATNANFPRITNNTTLAGTGYAVPFVQSSPPDLSAGYSTLFVDSGSTQGMTYTPTTDTLNVTASFAVSSSTSVSSSYSSNASVEQVNSQRYDDGSSILTGDFKFIGGKVNMTSGVATTTAFPSLIGKIIGDQVFVTANYITTLPASGATDAIIVDSIDINGAIIFTNNQPGTPSTATLVFTGFYI